MRTRIPGVLLATLFILCPAAFAQSPTGTIDGRVMDATGAVLPGVAVTLTHQATHATREVVSDAEGNFSAPLLPVGAYTLQAALPGFQPVEQHDVTLTVGQTLTLRLELGISAMKETVEVVDAPPVIETSRSQVSSTVNETSVQNLPVNGRNFIDFALLTP